MPSSPSTGMRTRARVNESSRSGPTPISTTSPTADRRPGISGRATWPRSREPSKPSATRWLRGGRSSCSSSSRPRRSIRAAARPPCCGARTAASPAWAERPSTEAGARTRQGRLAQAAPHSLRSPGRGVKYDCGSPKMTGVDRVPAALSMPPSGGIPATGAGLPSGRDLVDSSRRLAAVFHHVLSEQALDTLLDRIADTLAELIPYDTLSIFEANEAQTELVPVLARDRWADQIMRNTIEFGTGLAGWAAKHREPVLTNAAHLDPRMVVVPGTPPDEREALITVPLIARDSVKGVLSIYRLGEQASFDTQGVGPAQGVGDAAALALDNAKTRARLELQAQTDSLTGLYNHRYFHEHVRSELTLASRSRGSVALLMLDIDDFKKVNDIYGHAVGDHVLRELAEQLKAAVRGSDLVCRLGGEEFGVVMGSCGAEDAVALAKRLAERLQKLGFGPAGKITVSVGVAEGPVNASNPRELIACAEAAMMTAKARGKDLIVVFDDSTYERPDSTSVASSRVRSIAHLKMLQSLAGKLNRLNDVRQIGTTIADELRGLIDYHNCRVSIVDGDEIIPIAFRGVLSSRRGKPVQLPRVKLGEGITGRAVTERRSLLVANALDCDYAVMIPGTETLEESLLAVPL